MPLKNDSVAQLVEQLTLNQWVEGSSPSGVTSKKANQFIINSLAFFVPCIWRDIGEIIYLNEKSTLFGVNLQGAICNQNIALCATFASKII